jgi:hypothetical protein
MAVELRGTRGTLGLDVFATDDLACSEAFAPELGRIQMGFSRHKKTEDPPDENSSQVLGASEYSEMELMEQGLGGQTGLLSMLNALIMK